MIQSIPLHLVWACQGTGSLGRPTRSGIFYNGKLVGKSELNPIEHVLHFLKATLKKKTPQEPSWSEESCTQQEIQHQSLASRLQVFIDCEWFLTKSLPKSTKKEHFKFTIVSLANYFWTLNRADNMHHNFYITSQFGCKYHQIKLKNLNSCSQQGAALTFLEIFGSSYTLNKTLNECLFLCFR